MIKGDKMKIEDAYLHSLQKAEQNITNGGIKLDKARFIQLFNSEQNRFVRYLLDKKNDDTIREAQRLIVYDKHLKRMRSNATPPSEQYELPGDFFDHINVHGKFRQGKCSSSDFLLWEAKNENVHELLNDEDNKPSFDFRETFYSIGENALRIYTGDFNVVSLFLDYYRYPVQVDIEGYIHSDKTPSTSIDPEWDDRAVNLILNMVERQFGLNEDDLTRFQFDNANVTTAH